jgi:hypothetical protein
MKTYWCYKKNSVVDWTPAYEPNLPMKRTIPAMMRRIPKNKVFFGRLRARSLGSVRRNPAVIWRILSTRFSCAGGAAGPIYLRHAREGSTMRADSGPSEVDDTNSNDKDTVQQGDSE